MPVETIYNMAEKISPTIPLNSGFTHLLFNLAAQGYHWIRIKYSGGGDEGCVDEVELIPAGHITIEDGEVKDDDDYDVAELCEEMEERVKNLVTDKLLQGADDWYNNEGGGGTMYISTLDASYHGDHYYNVTETVDSVLTGKVGDDN